MSGTETIPLNLTRTGSDRISTFIKVVFLIANFALVSTNHDKAAITAAGGAALVAVFDKNIVSVIVVCLSFFGSCCGRCSTTSCDEVQGYLLVKMLKLILFIRPSFAPSWNPLPSNNE